MSVGSKGDAPRSRPTTSCLPQAALVPRARQFYDANESAAYAAALGYPRVLPSFPTTQRSRHKQRSASLVSLTGGGEHVIHLEKAARRSRLEDFSLAVSDC